MAGDGEMSVPIGGMFLSFTKPSKGIVAVLVAGFLAHAVSPYTTANFSLIPAKSKPFFWNIVTACYLETTISGLAVSIFTLLVVGRFLEPLWGSREFFEFTIFVNFFTSTITFVLAIFLYIITRVENFLPFVILVSTIIHNIFRGRRSQGAQDGIAWIELKKAPSMF